MKNKLWVYGCSYSDVWGDNTLEDSWFGIVANDLNLSCIGWDEDKEGRSRYSIAGSGWLETQQAILNTAKDWNPQDIIIIEEPPRVRTKIFNLDSQYSQPHNDPNEILSKMVPVDYTTIKHDYPNLYTSEYEVLEGWRKTEDRNDKNWVKVQEMLNFLQYRDTILSLSNLHPNIWTWSNDGIHINWYLQQDGTRRLDDKNPFWNEYKERMGNRLLTFGDIDNYVEWMCEHPSYWQNIEHLDNHQNKEGHIAMGWWFSRQIKENYQYI